MQPSKSPTTRSAVVVLSSGPVHYLDADPGVGGIPIILLHANPGDARDFEAVMPALACVARVIALDWPGYGGSSMPAAPDQWRAERLCDVLREFVLALGVQRAWLVGNSVGGNAAARLAIESPAMVAGLVLVAPGGFTPHRAVTRAFCRLQGSAFSLPPHWWAALCLHRRTAATRGMLTRASREHRSPARLALNRSIWRSFAQPPHDLREMAPRISCPTLLLFGRQDPAISALKDGGEARRCIPHAAFHVLPCGHAPFAEMPEAFLQLVQPFLASGNAEWEPAEEERSRLR